MEAAVYLEGGKRPETQEKEWSSGSVTLEILRALDAKPHYISGLVCKGDGSHKTFLIFILDFCPHVCTPHPFVHSFQKYLSSGWPCVYHLMARPQQYPYLHGAYGSEGDTGGHGVAWWHENIAFLNAFFLKRAHMQRADFLNSLQKVLTVDKQWNFPPGSFKGGCGFSRDWLTDAVARVVGRIWEYLQISF